MSLLILVAILFQGVLSDPNKCNYFYDDLAQSPVPLDVCYWRGKGLSYGFYCTKEWNGTTYSDTMVVHLKFNASDCPGGLEGGKGFFHEEALIYNCTEKGDECHCDGNPELCTIATTANCNETDPVEEDYVFDICIDNALSSTKWSCNKNRGVWGMGWEESGCSGDRITPAPTPSPLGISGDPFCWQTDCGFEETKKEGVAPGVIALIVILCICVCLCGVIGVWYVMRKKKADQYFDSNATTGF